MNHTVRAGFGRRAVTIGMALVLPAAGAVMAGSVKRALRWLAADLIAIAILVAAALTHTVSLLVIFIVLALAFRVIEAVSAFRAVFQPIRVGRALLLCAGMVLVEDLATGGIREHLVESLKVPSENMVPAMLVGDHVFADKQARHPARGDVILFLYPREPDKRFVKRVIGVGGDTVEVRNDVILLNGNPVERRHLVEDCHYDWRDPESNDWQERSCDVFEEKLDGRGYRVVFDLVRLGRSRPATTVAPGHYFVMGDNRDNSYDSRFFGLVPADNVLGVVRWVWFSTGSDGVRWERIGRRVD